MPRSSLLLCPIEFKITILIATLLGAIAGGASSWIQSRLRINEWLAQRRLESYVEFVEAAQSLRNMTIELYRTEQLAESLPRWHPTLIAARSQLNKAHSHLRLVGPESVIEAGINVLGATTELAEALSVGGAVNLKLHQAPWDRQFEAFCTEARKAVETRMRKRRASPGASSQRLLYK